MSQTTKANEKEQEEANKPKPTTNAFNTQQKKIWCKLNHGFIIRYKWNVYTMLRVCTYNFYFNNNINVLIIISATKNDKSNRGCPKKVKTE